MTVRQGAAKLPCMTDMSAQVRVPPALTLGFLARLAFLAVAFTLDKLLLNPFVDFERAHSVQGFEQIVQLTWHWGIRFLIAMAAAITVFAAARNPARLQPIAASFRETALRPSRILIHLVFVGALVPLSYLLYRDDPVVLPFAAVVVFMLVLAIAAVWAAFTAMAATSVWLNAARSLGILWLYSVIAAILGTCAWQLSLRLWAPTTALTFDLVRWLLAPILPELRVDAAIRVIGTDQFAVQIDEFCSGLEGVGLMLAFCSAWLLYFRKEYILPRALVLLPAGLLLIFSLNVLRIAALVLIGQSGFSAAAVYGFHSQAGWIAFNVAACALAYVSRRSTWLSRSSPAAGHAEPTENPTASYLLPLLAVLAVGVVAQAVSNGFETLYPLRFFAGAAALWLCRRRFASMNWQCSWRGAAVGALMFLVWILAAQLTVASAPMPRALAALSPGLRSGWIASRVLATVLTVPIAEELAYRGYLMRRLTSSDFESVPFQSVRWPALLVSAVVFGLPHGLLWWPGIVAGLAYGALVVRTGRIGEAVVGHAITNALIAAAVLFCHQWQLW